MKEEETKTREDDVQRREEEIIVAQKELKRKQEEIMNEVKKREKGVARRERVIEEQEKKLSEATLKRKRLAEDGPTGAEKKFCDLGPRRKQEQITAALKELKVLGRSDGKEILRELNKRVFGEDDVISQVQQLKDNIAFFCATQLPSLQDQSRIAAALTRGLSLREAADLSGVPGSSISWGRGEIKEGRPTEKEVRTNTSKKNCRSRTSHLSLLSLSESIQHLGQLLKKRGSGSGS